MGNYINYLRSIIVLPLLTILVLVSCSENKDVVSQGKINDTSCNFAFSRINVDVSNPEIFSVITKDGDTLTYFGCKNTDGTVSGIYSIEYTTRDGITSFIDLDGKGYVTNITNNKGASIAFEWLTSTSAVIKAHSFIDNVFISTVVDFSNSDVDKAPAFDSSKPAKQRKGDLSLEIVPLENEPLIIDQNKVMGSPWTPDDDMPASQKVMLSIYQCEQYCDARNYLELRNSKTGEYICRFIKPEKIARGKYQYTIPESSYPSVASYKELCRSIDESLSVIQNVLGETLAERDHILAALNMAASSTGLDAIPYVFDNAIALAATVSDYGQQILQVSGISGIIRRTDSEWHFKSYKLGYVSLCPVAFNIGNRVRGEECISETSESIFVKLDMQSDPAINSFEINPSCPAKEVDYEVTAEYHCIPDGSTISISVVGTDGYKNLITKKISGSGQAVLRVPGAETGVCDVCNIVIDVLGVKTIEMQASLVFGE